MSDLVIYRGCQYPADRLPVGADPAEVTPLDEWFAANRVAAPEHKPIAVGDRGPEVVTPIKPGKGVKSK